MINFSKLLFAQLFVVSFMISMRSFDAPCSDGNIGIYIDWNTSEDSELSATQRTQGTSFVKVNDKHKVSFYTEKSSIAYKSDGVSSLSSRSVGCFPQDQLLISGNSFSLGIIWPYDGREMGAATI